MQGYLQITVRKFYAVVLQYWIITMDFLSVIYCGLTFMHDEWREEIILHFWLSKEHCGIVVCSTHESMGSHKQCMHQLLVHPWQIPDNHWRYLQCRIYQTIQRQRNDFQILSCLRGNQVQTWGHPEAQTLNWISMQPRLILANLEGPIHNISPQANHHVRDKSGTFTWVWVYYLIETWWIDPERRQ